MFSLNPVFFVSADAELKLLISHTFSFFSIAFNLWGTHDMRYWLQILRHENFHHQHNTNSARKSMHTTV